MLTISIIHASATPLHTTNAGVIPGTYTIRTTPANVTEITQWHIRSVDQQTTLLLHCLPTAHQRIQQTQKPRAGTGLKAYIVSI
jgi:hypothetical protein